MMKTHTTTVDMPGGQVDVSNVVEDLPIVDLPEGLLGFPHLTKFLLVRMDDEGIVYDLTALEDEGLSFIVVPSFAFFPDYAPVIDESRVPYLIDSDEEDLLTLLIVTLGETLADSTANLMAPIVLDSVRRVAGQVVLDDQDFGIRVPLLAP